MVGTGHCGKYGQDVEFTTVNPREQNTLDARYGNFLLMLVYIN